MTDLLQNHTDPIFVPNIRELLRILATLPIGSCEAERSFSCTRRIHSFLRTTMSTERLSDLCVIAICITQAYPSQLNKLLKSLLQYTHGRCRPNHFFVHNRLLQLLVVLVKYFSHVHAEITVSPAMVMHRTHTFVYICFIIINTPCTALYYIIFLIK